MHSLWNASCRGWAVIFRGLFAGLLLALVVPGLALGATPQVGTIQGQITNGTSGGGSVAGVQVTLFATNSDNSTTHLTTTADASGHYEFKGVNSASTSTYVIGLNYQEADYYSDAQTFSDNETTKNVDITVYESTTDDSAITVVNAHTVMFLENGGLTIQELYVFANMSDRTYIGTLDAATGARGTLRFSLPAGFADLQFGGDLAATGVMASDTGFLDTAPVQPGAKQAFYSYTIPLKSSTYTYSRKIDYPTLKYSMLVQGDKVSIKSDNLTAAGTTNMGTTVFTNVTGSNLAAGSTLSATLSGLDVARKTSPLLWTGLGVIVVGLGLLGLYFLKRKKPETVSAPVDAQEEERLLAAIADLDDDFENGKIGEGPYRAARAKLKAELVELEKAKEPTTGG